MIEIKRGEGGRGGAFMGGWGLGRVKHEWRKNTNNKHHFEISVLLLSTSFPPQGLRKKTPKKTETLLEIQRFIGSAVPLEKQVGREGGG